MSYVSIAFVEDSSMFIICRRFAFIRKTTKNNQTVAKVIALLAPSAGEQL